MWYSIIRYGIFIVLFLLFLLIYKKHSKKFKKSVVITVLIITIILVAVSSSVPFENAFVTFSSPQTAFNYVYTEEIDEVVNGEESTLILYSNDTENAYSHIIFPKSESGWKIGTYFTYKTVASARHHDYDVSIYKHKDSDDHYVVIWEAFPERVVIAADNQGSDFRYHADKDSATDLLFVRYFTYINEYSSDYELRIDGETVDIH